MTSSVQLCKCTIIVSVCCAGGFVHIPYCRSAGRRCCWLWKSQLPAPSLHRRRASTQPSGSSALIHPEYKTDSGVTAVAATLQSVTAAPRKVRQAGKRPGMLRLEHSLPCLRTGCTVVLSCANPSSSDNVSGWKQCCWPLLSCTHSQKRAGFLNAAGKLPARPAMVQNALVGPGGAGPLPPLPSGANMSFFPVRV